MRSRSPLLAGFGAALLVAPLALAQQNLPADHPPIPPGTRASPTGAQLPPGHPPAAPGAVAQPIPANAQLPSGHPQITEGALPPTADALIEKLDATPGLLEREKTFEMAAMIGRLYLHRGRSTEARKFLDQARAQAAPLSALVIAQRAKLTPSEREQLASARCELSPEAGLEAHADAAAAHAAKGARVPAQACANAVLPSLLDTLDLAGKAAQLDGDLPAALAAHDQALALDPWAPESLFARAALLYETRGEDVKALGTAREGLKLYVEKHPQGPRLATAVSLLSRIEGAVKAGGVKAFLASERKARLARVAKELPTTANRSGNAAMAAAPTQAPGAAGGELPELTPEMVEAIQNTERTPELEAGLAKLVEEGEEHLARGRFEEALAAYRRVVPFQPQNGRAQAGMAWAMVGLGRGPMAERIWGVAVQGSPQAVEALGDTLKAKGNAEAARAVWTKLSQSDATYAARAGLSAKMK